MSEKIKDGSKGSPGGTQKDPQKEQKKKTLLAAVVMLLPFCICMWLIFGGGDKQDTPGAGAINLTIPDGRSAGIEASKQKAIERVTAEQKQQEHTLSLDGNSFALLEDPSQKRSPSGGGDNPIARSQQANRDAARAVSGFYSAPRTDPEVEQLRKQVEELSSRLEQQAVASPDPIALAEKQYALAAKYFNQGSGEPSRPSEASTSSRKAAVVPVRGLGEGTVSTLAAIEPDSLLQELGRERNLGFNTAVGGASGQSAHKGIRVCVDEDQTLAGGDRIRLRLTEPIDAGGRVLPAGSLLFGEAGIEGQRLQITVTGIEMDGDILSVEMEAYDLDGGKGLYVPDSKERTAAKEAAASIGSGLGSSISFARSAGQQVAMDLVRGAMTGGTQYVASKLRQVKVSVKSGYQLLLISKE